MSNLDDFATLIQFLAPGMPIPSSKAGRWTLFRALVNGREPGPASPVFLEIQDRILKAELAAKGITRLPDLAPSQDRMYLWQGDITTLEIEGIVNAANSALLGCFQPGHGCIDNAIHTQAGVQLRQACAELMAGQGHPEAVGLAKLTPGFNLPARWVIHTVGPSVPSALTEAHRQQLASCYRSCLALAASRGMKSLALCCISTGEFRFPPEAAAPIAVREVRRHLAEGSCLKAVVFNVFRDEDWRIYRALLA